MHPMKLSVTHKSGIERGAYSDTGQSRETAPYDRVAWWRIAGPREIAAEPRDLGQMEESVRSCSGAGDCLARVGRGGRLPPRSERCQGRS